MVSLKARSVPAGFDASAPPPPPRVGPLRAYVRFLGWMLREDPLRTTLALAMHLVDQALPAALVWLLRYAVQDALAVLQGTAPVGDLLRWVAAWALWGMVRSALWPLVQAVEQGLIETMEDGVQLRLQRKAAALRLEVFERADLQDILRRAREAAAPGTMMNLVQSVQEVPCGVAAIVAMAGVVGHWSPWLLAATLVAALPNPVAQLVQTRARLFGETANTPPANGCAGTTPPC